MEKKGFKYSLGYSDIKKVIPSRIMLPKMSAYGKDFDEMKYMFFFYKEMMNCQKNIMKFGKKSAILLKRIWY